VRSLAASHRRARGSHRVLAGFVSLLAVGVALATPHRPTADDEVLERVPARSALERLAPLRVAVQAQPDALEPALQLARGYIEIGRRESDPRFVAYAEATLAPWLAKAVPPEPALVLQAIALQYLHQFDAALALLGRALTERPSDGQAWLTRAGLLELRGDFDEARRACARLMRTADEIIALTCLSSVDGRSGRLAAAYSALQSVPTGDARLPDGIRSWVLAVRADMAERLGDDRAAESDLKTALGIVPEDPYLKATYADLLLRLDRPREVLTLLAGAEAQDPLLLRLAIAGRRTAAADAERWASLYAERSRAATQARDATHRREEALFLLDVVGDAPAALQAAAGNWTTQRETVDVRVYARATERARSGPDHAALDAWLAHFRYEDRALGSRAGAGVGQWP
jgi:tetratricopeptide (TPR) repeat protein